MACTTPCHIHTSSATLPSTLQLPRKQGRLQVLNLISQQQALQWRWAPILLLSAIPCSTFSTSSFLRYTFDWLYHSSTFPSAWYFLLFPSCRQPHHFPHRPSIAYSPLHIPSSLVQVIDAIPKSFDTCYINPTTCLSLPLPAVTSSSTPAVSSHHTASTTASFRTPNLQPFLCSDLFYFDTLTLQLELRQPLFTHSRHPALTRQAIRSINTSMISFLLFLQHNCMPASHIAQTLDSSFNLSPFIASFYQSSI
ncbi:hypothetical protein A0J61_10944 [Choanephora cucurbitarum]|uniref:Uncharacterized protein n=1 Tax=Choanephora cucurbitarum TaxID=101091 RepID=A0A1C7MW28_9FUNG|nr:hypothetical protein A0J61_10944 [Choanephora cucurbitarum]